MGQGFSVPHGVGNLAGNVVGNVAGGVQSGLTNLGSTVATFILPLSSNHHHDDNHRPFSIKTYGTHPANFLRRITGEGTSDQPLPTATASPPPNDDTRSSPPPDQAATVVSEQVIRFLQNRLSKAEELLSKTEKELVETKTVKVTGPGGTPVYSQGIVDIHGVPGIWSPETGNTNTTDYPTKARFWCVNMLESEPQIIPIDQLSKIEIHVGSVTLHTKNSSEWEPVLFGSTSEVAVCPFHCVSTISPLRFILSDEEVVDAGYNGGVRFRGMDNLPIRHGLLCTSVIFERDTSNGRLRFIDDLLRSESIPLSDEKWLHYRFRLHQNALYITREELNTPRANVSTAQHNRWFRTSYLVLQGLSAIGFNDEFAPALESNHVGRPEPTEEWNESVMLYATKLHSFITQNTNEEEITAHARSLRRPQGLADAINRAELMKQIRQQRMTQNTNYEDIATPSTETTTTTRRLPTVDRQAVAQIQHARSLSRSQGLANTPDNRAETMTMAAGLMMEIRQNRMMSD